MENSQETMLLLLSRFSRVQLCVTPQMAAHQAPPSLGFSRQEYWSGLPFPSPILTGIDDIVEKVGWSQVADYKYQLPESHDGYWFTERC